MTSTPKDISKLEPPSVISPPKSEVQSPKCNSPGMMTSPKSEVLKMNYSPKHSRKSSSLSLNRNINMKNLSLNLDNSSNTNLSHKEEGFGRKKSLSISIPDEIESPSYNNGTNGTILETRTISPIKVQTSNSTPIKSTSTFTTINSYKPDYLGTSKNENFKFPVDNDNVFTDINGDNRTFLNSFRNLKIPEELQELSQLDAYPNGPANVLNDCIYLYSEPTIEQINEYDLVINVAKECKDLSSSFNPHNIPGKQYVYIPWNHTSSISKELPRLTEIISQYDDSDSKSTNKKKILIHCHCGVSRSACVVVAYYMRKFQINVNDAYDMLKNGNRNIQDIKLRSYDIQSCSRVCPNMSLIFELMDFNDYLRTK